MTFQILSGFDDETQDCAQNFMCGQSLATCIIALIVLIECIVAYIIVWRNIHVKFSFIMIILIALNALANMINQVLQEPDKDYQTPFTVIGQAVSLFFIFNFIPMSIYFTQRQWVLYKRFQIRNALTQCEKTLHTRSYV